MNDISRIPYAIRNMFIVIKDPRPSREEMCK